MRFSEEQEEELGINLTPLIDVVFLLLIFFMVSTTFTKESQLSIQLPDAASTPSDKQPAVLLVEVNGAGEFAVKGPDEAQASKLIDTETDTLMRALKQSAGNAEGLVTVIRADRRTPHEAVVRVMDASRRLGYLKITFSTQSEPAAK